MLALSTKTRYSLRILLLMAADYPNTRSWKIKEISAAQDISEAYIEQIMIALKAHNLVASERGRFGGYTLRSEPADITILKLIEIFEGKVELARCKRPKVDPTPPSYSQSNHVWNRLAEVIRTEAKGISVASILYSLN